MSNDLKFAFHPEGWNIKIDYRSKNRMKFQLKLNQEEAEAFRNFANAVKPTDLGMTDFVRSLFFHGIRALEQELTTNMVQHMEQNREDYEASGFNFDDQGKLVGIDEATASGNVDIVED